MLLDFPNSCTWRDVLGPLSLESWLTFRWDRYSISLYFHFVWGFSKNWSYSTFQPKFFFHISTKIINKPNENFPLLDYVNRFWDLFDSNYWSFPLYGPKMSKSSCLNAKKILSFTRYWISCWELASISLEILSI